MVSTKVKGWIREHYKTVLSIAIGNFLVASGVIFFVLPNNILSGGVATVAIVLQPFIPVSEILIINIMTISLFFIGWIFLGTRFAMSDLLSAILYPIFISTLSLLDTTPFEGLNPILSAIYAGLLLGIGLGFVFRVGGSTGGMDIPALILHKYTHLSQSLCVMIVDGITIMLGLYTYGLNSVLTGIIAVFASSYAINWMMTAGSQAARNIMIISEKWEDIVQYLHVEIDRGVTLLYGQGTWTHEDKPVVMCVVTDRQYATITNAINQIDPKAFIIVNDVHEVKGSGFTFDSHAFGEHLFHESKLDQKKEERKAIEG